MGILQGLDPFFAASGFFVGFLVGTTGVGGGSLMTPLLVLLFGIHPLMAVGTDLLFAAVTKSVGTAVHGLNKTIDWKIVRNLAAGSLPAALMMLWFVSEEGKKERTAHLAPTIGAILVAVALLTLARPVIVQAIAHRRTTHPAMSVRARSLATTGLGLLIGALVTISSVGAGAMGVTVLLILFPKLKVHEVVGSDIMHAVPLTIIAGAGYWYLGEVNLGMLGSLLVGSIPGVIVGSLMAPKLPDRVLRPVLATVLAAAGLKMLVI